MGKKYYIPNLSKFLGKKGTTTTELMKIDSRSDNIIEFNNDSDINNLLKLIEDYDFVNDKEVKEFFDVNFPEISKELTTMPIDLEELKRTLRFLFSELPDEFFEEKNVVVFLKKALNFLFRKKEAFFIMTNVKNGTLEYKDIYRHTGTLDFYYGMIKLTYDLETYYSTLCDAQSVIHRALLRDILFNNRKLGRAELNLINRSLNLTGNYFVEFQTRLDEMQKEIREHKQFIKRTYIAVPVDYYKQEFWVTEKIKETIKDTEERIKKVQEAKKMIEEEVNKHKGILTLDNAKIILELVIDFLKK